MTKALAVGLAGLLLAALLVASPAATRSVKEGGTFRVGIPPEQFSGAIDPVLPYTVATGIVFGATCAGLLRTRDEPLPAGYRLVPEVAAGFPRITNGGKTYTWTVRRGFRFSTGKRVTALDVARSINRALDPVLQSPNVEAYRFIVGAQAVLDGRAETASGLKVKGSTLTIRLTKAVGKLLQWVGLECILPEATPTDPEGLKAPIPAAGPYYIAEYVLGQRVVLERNRFYGGDRRHQVDRFVIDLETDAASVLERVERSDLDYGFASIQDYEPRAEQLRLRYGINRSRFHIVPGTFLRLFVLNTSRPLFKNNVRLRRAVNFAVDRKAILRERGTLAGSLTDQYLPSTFPGFRDERIYPLATPDIPAARRLAKGRLRGGKAVLYASARPFAIAQAQILKDNLKKIGLDVDVRTFPAQVLFEKLASPGEPFDIGWVGWEGGFPLPDPSLLTIFDGRTIGRPDNVNWSYFNSPRYNALLERASRLTGDARDRAYGDLDVDLAKNAAPAIALSYDNVLTLVSDRPGCVVVKPYLDLAAVCLK